MWLLLSSASSYFNPQVPCGTRRYDAVPVCSKPDFNPQVPCGTRLSNSILSCAALHFNPQVPCGTRHNMLPGKEGIAIFQSTGPLRDPTPYGQHAHPVLLFQSTGPLRDPTFLPFDINILTRNFNPQVPCGTRHHLLIFPVTHSDFNPQVPCGTRLCAPHEPQYL